MLDFYRGRGNRLCGGDQRAMQTGEACDRPLETFGSMLLEFYRKLYFGFPNKHAGVV